MSDPVNKPKHYTSHPSGVECIDVVEWMPFNLGNAIKYIWRCGIKHDVPMQDLHKAVWYLCREILRLGGEDPRGDLARIEALKAERDALKARNQHLELLFEAQAAEQKL